MNIFKEATQNKLRLKFNGSTFLPEDLYDLPLQSQGHVSLDKIAIELNNKIKSMETESFVMPNNTNQASSDVKLAFELVKDVIADKQLANEAKRDSKVKQSKRDRLDALIESKLVSADAEKTLEELQLELANL